MPKIVTKITKKKKNTYKIIFNYYTVNSIAFLRSKYYKK